MVTNTLVVPSLWPAPGTLPEGRRIYAIGDVHGCAGRFFALHEAIAADLAARPTSSPLLIHLGDVIDRGPDSAACVERLRRPTIPGLPMVNLMGNHEAMMLAALEPGNSGDTLHWLENGGGKALESWGLSPASPAATWRRGLPAGTEAFLRDLVLSYQEGPYVFVHAGLRPGVALAAQTAKDKLWIRGRFLDHQGDLDLPDAPGVVVVHGHTPMAVPVIQPHRISIDTGAVLGGLLTCLVLEADHFGFLFT
jgi:serine/threonine protein phosphatase 1